MRAKRIKETIVIYAAVTLLATSFGRFLVGAPAPDAQVVFVCEHGNVKSLMAATYFNELAQARGVSLRALSRGSAPDSTTVPPAIAAALKQEGFDVARFEPMKVTASDVREARYVVLIGTSLPESLNVTSLASERWDDIPPASTHYDASSRALKRRVEQLVDQLLMARSSPTS